MDRLAQAADAAVDVPFQTWNVRKPVGARTAVFAMAIALSLFIAALALRFGGREVLDGPLMGLLGRMTHRSVAFDLLMRAVDRFELFQGVPIFALAYAAFASADSTVRRAKVVCGCIAAALAAVTSRLTATTTKICRSATFRSTPSIRPSAR